jgi:hypothetical protein
MRTQHTKFFLAIALCFTMVFVLTIPAFAENDGNESAAATGTMSVTDKFMEAQHTLLDDPAKEYWPATRWWMAEGLHTDATIKKEMKQLHDMGISLVEIVCMPESNVDDNAASAAPEDNTTGKTSKELYGWGSDEWTNDTKLVIQEATKYGMGFSMTSGTHWANANLPIGTLGFNDDGAGKALGYAVQTASGGAAFNGTLPRSPISAATKTLGVTRQDLVSVVAVKRAADNTGSIGANSAITGTMKYTGESVVLTGDVTLNSVPVTEATMQDPAGTNEYKLNWTPPDSDTWDIYAFWIQGTGQTATPSATTNVTINYIDEAGMDTFIDYYDTEIFNDADLKNTIISNGKGEMYMDSLEISATNGNTGQFWGYSLIDEFESRRGYSIEPYLPFIIKTSTSGWGGSTRSLTASNDNVTDEKIRNDLYETMTDMYINNVLHPLKSYLNDEMNMKLRAEITYGVTYEITTPAQAVDYVESESLEFANQLDSHRTLAGASHAYGLRYSSETGAVMGHNYLWGQDRFMQIINTQFASGISHTVFHGYSSIEGTDGASAWDGTYWPGHEGMQPRFSERWGPRQPESTMYEDYMPMIARNQAVLQQGKPQIDLAVMRTDYFYNNKLSSSSTDKMRNRKAFYIRDLELQDNGYTYDYFAPEILETLRDYGIKDYSKSEGLIPDNVGYQALVLYQDSIRIESAKVIYNLAKKGLPVVIVNGLTENRTPDEERTHEQSCVYTLSNDGKENALAEVMAEMKKLANVKEVNAVGLPDNPITPNPNDSNYEEKYYYGNTGLYEALQELGVQPRAKYEKPNKSILTAMRRTGDTLYLWAYNYMEKRGDYFNKPIESRTETATISVDALGKPYSIDTWTGDISPLADYKASGGRTTFNVTLNPGETTVIALDLTNRDAAPVINADGAKAIVGVDGPSLLATDSGTYRATLSNGSVVTKSVSVPNDIDLSDAQWNLVLNSWTAGEKVTVREPRAGYTTKEVYYTTNKTDINVGATALMPWKDMTFSGQTPASVSGVGTYRTSFTLPSTWGKNNGAYLNIGSTGGSLAELYVNGQKVKGYDFVGGRTDVSEWLKAGDNVLEIKVASPLRNQLVNINYYSSAGAGSAPGVGDYGLMGKVVLDMYTIEPLTSTTESPDTPPVPSTPTGPTDQVKSPEPGATLSPVSIAESIAVASKIADQTWTGKQIKPAVSISVSGKLLVANTDYQISYGANKFIGKGSVTVTGKGAYTGAKTLTFKIVPKKNSMKKIAVGKKSAKVSFNKVSSAQKVTGYQVQYRQKGTSTWKIKTVSAKKSSVTIKGLKKGKQYQFRVRAYKTVAKVKYEAPWSAAKTSKKIK